MVENPGRVNFSVLDDERKGILKNIIINSNKLNKEWNILSIPFYPSQIDSLPIKTGNDTGSEHVLPALFEAELVIEEPNDTHILMKGKYLVMYTLITVFQVGVKELYS